MVFLLMAAHNIRSIEQMKNVRKREAGVVLGLRRVVSKPKLWEWFYAAADQGLSKALLRDYFGYQMRAGLVGVWMWFTDGHRLPYTGKEHVHCNYNTQRRMVLPGHMNLVTSDSDGRIVDISIQEGQGDMRTYIHGLSAKWKSQLDGEPIRVFDREGYGAPYFWKLVNDEIPFVTWDKNIKSEALARIAPERWRSRELTRLCSTKLTHYVGRQKLCLGPPPPAVRPVRAGRGQDTASQTEIPQCLRAAPMSSQPAVARRAKEGRKG